MDRISKLSELRNIKRTFSKRITFATFVLAWAFAFVALYFDADGPAITALTLVGTVVGTYMSVGHLDYRSILNALKGTPANDSNGPMGN